MITTFTLLKYTGLSQRISAFANMGLSSKWLEQIEGVTFGKMLGSGAGTGFSMWPDFGTYALLFCWEDKVLADNFFSYYEAWDSLKENSSSQHTLYLQAVQAHGKWDGIQPFDTSEASPLKPNEKVAVLTRATIHRSKLLRFWKHVPAAGKSLKNADPAPLFSKGIGELPLVQQATLSIWNSQDDLMKFAYGQQSAHKEIVKSTRRENWYSEDLFARFRILDERDW